MKDRLLKSSAWADKIVGPGKASRQKMSPPGSVQNKHFRHHHSASASAQSAGDTAWVLVCAAVVLMVTGPGFAPFYSGRDRRMNGLSRHPSRLLARVLDIVRRGF
jgi:hypothetical protein